VENFAIGMLMFGFRDSKLEEECYTYLFKIPSGQGRQKKIALLRGRLFDMWHSSVCGREEGEHVCCWWLGSCLHQMPGGLLQMRAAWSRLLCIAFWKPEKRNI